MIDEIRPAYRYRALVTRVVDGDTILATVHLGFRVSINDQRIQLYGVDAPAVETEPGIASKEELKSMLGMDTAIVGSDVVIETVKDQVGNDQADKWDRWLATVWTKKLDGSWTNVNEALIAGGFAQAWPIKPMGEPIPPTPPETKAVV